jgi:Zn-dependent peptidase ImmA (M78 family)
MIRLLRNIYLKLLLRNACILIDEYIDEGYKLTHLFKYKYIKFKVLKKSKWIRFYGKEHSEDFGIMVEKNNMYTIHINSIGSLLDSKLTIIHELYHIYQHQTEPNEYHKALMSNNPNNLFEKEASFMEFLAYRLKLKDMFIVSYYN